MLVLRGYTTLGELDQLSFDDIDVMLMAMHAWDDATPQPQPNAR